MITSIELIRWPVTLYRMTASKKTNTKLPTELWLDILAMAQQGESNNLKSVGIISVENSQNGKPLLKCSLSDKAENPLANSNTSLSTSSSVSKAVLDKSTKLFITTLDNPSASEAEQKRWDRCKEEGSKESQIIQK